MESSPVVEGLRPRSCWIEVDLDNLDHNLEVVRASIDSGSDVLAVVKAEAYGHGAEVIAESLSDQGVRYFGVATLEEALKLREYGIEENILIMGHMATFNVDTLIDHNLTPFVFSFRLLHSLNEEAQSRGVQAPFHLKIDTGMGRLGLLPGDLKGFFDELDKCDYVELEGVATHLAVAGENPNYTADQYDEFRRVQEFTASRGYDPEYWHVMNSAAVFSSNESLGNMVRPGITLYGYPPLQNLSIPELKPVMQVKTKMADYKQLPSGKGISYGRVHSPETPTWIGVLPIGYADGYPRNLTEQAYVLKNGRPCPVLGNVCMDMTIIGLAEHDDPEETVVLIGRDGDEELWADQLAEWLNTIPYEILSNFSRRLPRLYFRDHSPVAMKSEQEVRQLESRTREDLGLDPVIR